MKWSAWRVLRAILMALGTAVLLASLLLLAANLWVLGQTRERIEHELPLCGAERVGIVFGTSHWTRSGVRNPYFDARMSASARCCAWAASITCCSPATTVPASTTSP